VVLAGLLLLCDVALGTPRQLKRADYYASNLPSGTHSTHGMGRTGPSPSGTVTTTDGVKVPMGKHQPTKVDGTCTFGWNVRLERSVGLSPFFVLCVLAHFVDWWCEQCSLILYLSS